MIPAETAKILSQKIIYHRAQFELFNSTKKFIVIAAGRRSGKTFTSKRKLIKAAFTVPGRYYCAAPTYPQARAIFWDDLKAYIIPLFRKGKPNETRGIIFLKNGSEIHIVGLDSAARFEGQPWTGGIIDEFDDLKDDVWTAHVRPALDTIGLNTWCIMCGVPEGKRLLYDLSKKPAYDDNYAYYHWKSAEVLESHVIEAAKRDLSAIQFRQEYEASFETAEGSIYPDYDSIKNGSKATINESLPIQWMHDFNYTPLSSAIIQDHDDGHHVVDEIVLHSAVAQNTAIEFKERFKGHKNKRVYIFGDYSGTSGENHNQSSDYTTIEKILRKDGWNVSRHVRPNPLVKERQNSTRALICNANGERKLFVNVGKCKYVDNALSRTKIKKGASSSYQEEEDEFQHMSTAIGYWSFTRFPVTNGVRLVQSSF